MNILLPVKTFLFVLLFFVCCVVQPVSLRAQHNAALTTYTLGSENGFRKVTIEYHVDYETAKPDTTVANVRAQAKEQWEDLPNSNKPRSIPYLELKNQINRVIHAQAGLRIIPNYPAYILDMVALIKETKMREEALAIYLKNNPEILSIITSSATMSYNGGKTFKNETTITIVYLLEVKQPSKLYVPSFFLEIQDNVFQTAQLFIELSPQ